MASISDITTAAYRIGQSAQEAQLRAASCVHSLRTQSTQLAAAVHGSRTGEDAVRQVQQAERAVRESAVRLGALRATVDRFIQDLTK